MKLVCSLQLGKDTSKVLHSLIHMIYYHVAMSSKSEGDAVSSAKALYLYFDIFISCLTNLTTIWLYIYRL